MAYSLELPAGLRGQGWRVKIRDKETVEPPHVSVIKGTRTWRIDLRSKRFMDRQPPPREVPDELMAVIEDSWDELCSEWDEMYPPNPVGEER